MATEGSASFQLVQTNNLIKKPEQKNKLEPKWLRTKSSETHLVDLVCWLGVLLAGGPA
jgi:hypothetical protein